MQGVLLIRFFFHYGIDDIIDIVFAARYNFIYLVYLTANMFYFKAHTII